MLQKSLKFTYDCQNNKPLEDNPADEPHGSPPEDVGPWQEEQRAGQLSRPLLPWHRFAPGHLDWLPLLISVRQFLKGAKVRPGSCVSHFGAFVGCLVLWAVSLSQKHPRVWLWKLILRQILGSFKGLCLGGINMFRCSGWPCFLFVLLNVELLGLMMSLMVSLLSTLTSVEMFLSFSLNTILD